MRKLSRDPGVLEQVPLLSRLDNGRTAVLGSDFGTDSQQLSLNSRVGVFLSRNYHYAMGHTRSFRPRGGAERGMTGLNFKCPYF